MGERKLAFASPGSLDIVNNVICGSVTSFSPFAVVTDILAPEVDFGEIPSELWPPNNKMVTVATGIAATDNVAVTDFEVTVTASHDVGVAEVTVNEDGTYAVALKATRPGRSTGLVYTIHARAADGAGNVTETSVDVTVPHDQGNGKGR